MMNLFPWELEPLPEEIHGIVFVVEVRSNHTFADVLNPEVRIANGLDDKDLVKASIIGDEASHSNAFVFAAIYRDHSSPTDWSVNNVCEHPDVSQIQEWASYLAQYLD